MTAAAAAAAATCLPPAYLPLGVDNEEALAASARTPPGCVRCPAVDRVGKTEAQRAPPQHHLCRGGPPEHRVT